MHSPSDHSRCSLRSDCGFSLPPPRERLLLRRRGGGGGGGGGGGHTLPVDTPGGGCARGKLGAKCQKCPSLEITARSALLPRRNPRSGLVPSAPPTTGTRMLRRDRIAGGTPEEPHHRPERRRIYPLAPLLAPPTLHARALLSSPRRSPPPIPPAAAVSYPPSAVRARARRIMRARRLLLLPRAIPRETRRS